MSHRPIALLTVASRGDINALAWSASSIGAYAYPDSLDWHILDEAHAPLERLIVRLRFLVPFVNIYYWKREDTNEPWDTLNKKAKDSAIRIHWRETDYHHLDRIAYCVKALSPEKVVITGSFFGEYWNPDTETLWVTQLESLSKFFHGHGIAYTKKYYDRYGANDNPEAEHIHIDTRSNVLLCDDCPEGKKKRTTVRLSSVIPDPEGAKFYSSIRNRDGRRP